VDRALVESEPESLHAYRSYSSSKDCSGWQLCRLEGWPGALFYCARRGCAQEYGESLLCYQEEPEVRSGNVAGPCVRQTGCVVCCPNRPPNMQPRRDGWRCGSYWRKRWIIDVDTTC
jgi:hypothetical protein